MLPSRRRNKSELTQRWRGTWRVGLAQEWQMCMIHDLTSCPGQRPCFHSSLASLCGHLINDCTGPSVFE